MSTSIIFSRLLITPPLPTAKNRATFQLHPRLGFFYLLFTPHETQTKWRKKTAKNIRKTPSYRKRFGKYLTRRFTREKEEKSRRTRLFIKVTKSIVFASHSPFSALTQKKESTRKIYLFYSCNR